MKKLYLAICALALPLMLSACNDSGPTVAVVNAAQVYTECESGKQAREYLEKIAEEMQNDLLELQAAAERAPVAQRQAAIEKLQTTSLEYQQRIRLEEQQILNKISEDYQTAVDEYRKANNIDVILRAEVIVSTSERADITEAIIAAMNKKTEAENKAAMAAAGQNATAEEGIESPANATTEEGVTEEVVTEEEPVPASNATAE